MRILQYYHSEAHIKKRGILKFIAHPASVGLRKAFQPRISNAEAHAVCIFVKIYANHGH